MKNDWDRGSTPRSLGRQLIVLPSMSSERDFDKLVVESIDETITELLSRRVLNALYAHLEKFHSIRRNEIPTQLEALSTTLENTLGTASSRTINKVIAKKLYTKLGIPFDAQGNSPQPLTAYIDLAKSQFTEQHMC